MRKKKASLPGKVHEYLSEQLAKVASEGGKARWKGVSAEEHKKISSEGGKKSGETRRKQKLERERLEREKRKE